MSQKPLNVATYLRKFTCLTPDSVQAMLTVWRNRWSRILVLTVHCYVLEGYFDNVMEQLICLWVQLGELLQLPRQQTALMGSLKAGERIQQCDSRLIGVLFSTVAAACERAASWAWSGE